MKNAYLTVYKDGYFLLPTPDPDIETTITSDDQMVMKAVFTEMPNFGDNLPARAVNSENSAYWQALNVAGETEIVTSFVNKNGEKVVWRLKVTII